jgi:3-deoxy-D-manno-oct-2-ulosonic acid (Kdo) hydroxylase
VHLIDTLAINTWLPVLLALAGQDWHLALELGHVIALPNLAFALSAQEAALMQPEQAARISSAKRKSVYLRPGVPGVQGLGADRTHAEVLTKMIARYRDQASALAALIFPHYAGQFRPGPTSFRPREQGGQSLSWRKDDSRLHVDSFPSSPTHGQRIFRVFTNVNPLGLPRTWRVGEPFEPMAQRFLPKVKPYRRWQANLLQRLGATKSLRTPYDHTMSGLHDAAKADLDYQKNGPQQTVQFAAGSSWICLSDQIVHAATDGQFMLEQTLWLPPQALRYPELSPLAVLQRLQGGD